MGLVGVIGTLTEDRLAVGIDSAWVEEQESQGEGGGPISRGSRPVAVLKGSRRGVAKYRLFESSWSSRQLHLSMVDEAVISLFFGSSRGAQPLTHPQLHRSSSSSTYSSSSIPDEVEDGEEGVIVIASPSLSKGFEVLATSLAFLLMLVFSNAKQRSWDQHTGWDNGPFE